MPHALRKQSRGFLDELTAFLRQRGGELEPDMQRALRALVREHPDLLVRREDPGRLFAALASGSSIPIAHEHGEPYANTAVLGSGLEGLRVPYQFGFGKLATGAFVFVSGFTPSDAMEVRELPREAAARVHGADATRMRMVTGELPLRDLHFVMVRMPHHMFPENRMTNAELEREQITHVSRMFTFRSAAKPRTAQ